MKKLLLLLAVLVSSITGAGAQTKPPCEGCTPTVRDTTIFYPLCEWTKVYYGWICNEFDPGQPGAPCIDSTWGPVGWDSVGSAYAILSMKITTCGQFSGVSFGSMSIVDNRAYYVANYGPPDFPCNLPSPATIFRDIRARYIQSTGSQPMAWVYPIACLSMVQVEWPAGANLYYFPPEGPNMNVGVGGPLIKTTEFLPCNVQACCRYIVQYDSVRDRIRTIYSPDSIGCNGARFTATTFTRSGLDSNKRPVTYTGKVVRADPCQPYCVLHPSFKVDTRPSRDQVTVTSFQAMPDPMDLTVAPTPAHESVTFSSMENIERIEISDFMGRRVATLSKLSSNTIDISKLEKGLHYVRVYFNNGELRTLKILKE